MVYSFYFLFVKTDMAGTGEGDRLLRAYPKAITDAKEQKIPEGKEVKLEDVMSNYRPGGW